MPSPKPAESTSEVSFPPWAEKAAQDILKRANVVSQQPYTPYPHARLASLNADHQSAFDLTRGLMGQYGTGGGAAAAGGGSGGGLLESLSRMMNAQPQPPASMDPAGMTFGDARDLFQASRDQYQGTRDDFREARDDFRSLPAGPERREARPDFQAQRDQFLQQRDQFGDVRDWFRSQDREDFARPPVSIDRLMEQVFGKGSGIVQSGSFIPTANRMPGFDPFTYGQTGGEAVFMRGGPKIGQMSPLVELLRGYGGAGGGGGGGDGDGTPDGQDPQQPPPPGSGAGHDDTPWWMRDGGR